MTLAFWEAVLIRNPGLRSAWIHPVTGVSFQTWLFWALFNLKKEGNLWKAILHLKPQKSCSAGYGHCNLPKSLKGHIVCPALSWLQNSNSKPPLQCQFSLMRHFEETEALMHVKVRARQPKNYGCSRVFFLWWSWYTRWVLNQPIWKISIKLDHLPR